MINPYEPPQPTGDEYLRPAPSLLVRAFALLLGACLVPAMVVATAYTFLTDPDALPEDQAAVAWFSLGVTVWWTLVAVQLLFCVVHACLA
jgi:hypothetical protein